MKPGSLVLALKDTDHLFPFITCNKPLPKVGDIEEIKAITKEGGLLLVGFAFTVTQDGIAEDIQVQFNPINWREIQPPMSLDFIEELQTEKAFERKPKTKIAA